MPTNAIRPLRVEVAFERDGEALVTAFVCACGAPIVEADGPDQHVHAGIDAMRCGECDRLWEASWHGLRFCAAADARGRGGGVGDTPGTSGGE